MQFSLPRLAAFLLFPVSALLAQSVAIQRLTPSGAGAGDSVELRFDVVASGVPQGAEFVSAHASLVQGTDRIDLGAITTAATAAANFTVTFAPAATFEITGPASIETELRYRANQELRELRASRELAAATTPSITLSAASQPLNSWVPMAIATSGLNVAVANSVAVTFDNANGKRLIPYYGATLDYAQALREASQTRQDGQVRVSGESIVFGLLAATTALGDVGTAEEDRYIGEYDLTVRTTQTTGLPPGIVRRVREVLLRGGYRVTEPRPDSAIGLTAIRYAVADGPNAGLRGVWMPGGNNALNAAPGSLLRLELTGTMTFGRYWWNRLQLDAAREGEPPFASATPRFAVGTNGRSVAIQDQSASGDWRPLSFEIRLPDAETAPIVIALGAIAGDTPATPFVMSQPVTVVWRRAAQDVTVERIEVVQAVQNASNTIPLVAGKRTVARVFAAALGESPQAGVEVLLEGWRDGERLPGDARPAVNQAYPATAPAGPLDRARTDHSINFELPAEWLGAGALELRAEVRLTAGLTDPEPANNRFTAPAVRFVPSILPDPFPVLWYRACVQRDASLPGCPAGSAWTADDRTGLLRKLYPAADGAVRFRPLGARTRVLRADPGTAEFGYQMKLRALAASLSADAATAQVTAVFPAGGPAEASPVGAPVGWIRESDTAARNEAALAHAVGHSAGLTHPPADESAVGEVGFDVGSGTAIPASRFDVMAAGEPVWISPANYRRVMESRTWAGEAAGNPVDALLVSGWVSADAHAGELEPSLRVQSATAPLRTNPDGRFCFEFFAGDTPLTRTCFEPAAADSNGRSFAEMFFSHIVALPPGADRLALVGPEGQIASIQAGVPPELSIERPQPGERWSGRRQLSWIANSAGGGRVQNAIDVSADGGATWRPVDVLLTDASTNARLIDIDAADLPAGEEVLLRVVASTGWTTATATSARFAVQASPRIQASVARVDFGQTEPGAGIDRTVVLTNTGSGRLSFAGWNTDGASFTMVTTPPAVLEPGAAETIRVRFLPVSGGPHGGALVFSSNDPVTPELRVALEGIGIGDAPPPPRIALTPERLDFGAVPVNQSADRLLIIGNNGAGSLTVTGIDLPGALVTMPGPAAPFTIEAGLTREVVVRFSPAAEVELSGALTVRSTDPARPAVAVALTGRGAPPAPLAARAEAQPGSLSFGEVATGVSRDLTFVLRNSGTAPLEVASMAASPDVFTLIGASGSLTVAPGGQTQVTVRFTPAVTGVATGAVTIASNDPAGTLRVGLAGTGAVAAGGLLEATPRSLNFGNIGVSEAATLTVMLRNAGPGAVTVVEIATAGSAFSALAPGLPLTIAAGATYTLSVRFNGAAAGVQTGSVSIRSNGGNLTIPLAGTVLTPKLLRADDGTFEKYYEQIVEDAFFLNRLRPASYPATLRAIRIYVGVDTLRPGTQVTLLAAPHPSGSAELGQVTLRGSVTGRIDREGAWIEYAVPKITIESGDFLVGFHSAERGQLTVALDTTVTRERSYFSTNGFEFAPAAQTEGIGPANFGIQAILE
ncbi:MAG: choice-of-anchor D domain-containing protein [Bryobacteraceae bacterium]